ncbi:MAG: hypothetical protein QNJ27_04225, partial [Simkaniaceae bacterium]|nr:hypothetical protein [Simkaniaceae bacterium]
MPSSLEKYGIHHLAWSKVDAQHSFISTAFPSFLPPNQALTTKYTNLNSNLSKSTRGSPRNRLVPNPQATGSHTVFRRNSFSGKTFEKIDQMLRAKGFTTKGPNPLHGKGSYFSPTTSRKYYLDYAGKTYKGGITELPHVD